MDFPPFEEDIEKGEELWDTPFKNGKTYASCFKNGGKGLAVGYPFYDSDSKKMRTIEADINECRVRNGEEPIKNLKHGKMAQLVSPSNACHRVRKMAVKLTVLKLLLPTKKANSSTGHVVVN